MSTTCPWKGDGARKIRSTRLPNAPPSTRPREIAQGSERRRRAIQTIQPTTPMVISGKTQVWSAPMLQAAPLLRVRLR